MKQGTKVRITATRINGKPLDSAGHYGMVIKQNGETDNGKCYWVRLDNGHKRSFLEHYLIRQEKDYITLEDVIQAKNLVDKAQEVWVELLSAYQLQEASKK